MINKKFAMGLLALATAATLAACGGSNNNSKAGSSAATGSSAPASVEVDYTSATELDSTYTGAETLTYWTPTTDTDYMTAQVAAFKAANTGFTGDITMKANLGEGDVKTELLKDPEASADIMSIADDNIKAAVTGRALTAIGTTADKSDKSSIYYKLFAHEGSAAIDACSVGTSLYGYPYRNDNGYNLFYDKRIVSDTQAKSIEGIIAACKAANATFNFDITNSWYGASYLWANGCTTSTDTNGAFHANFANDNGVAAALAMQSLYAADGGTTLLFNGDATKFGVEGTGRVGAIIQWNNTKDLTTAVTAANLGISVLPTIKIGGVDKSLKSFLGYKAFSIRKATAMTAEKLKLAKAFCAFLTTKANQQSRLTTLGQGVSDRQVGADSTLYTNLPFLGCLNKMSAAGNVVPQATGSAANFWTPMTDFNTLIKNKTLTADNCLSKLQTMVTSMEKVD